MILFNALPKSISAGIGRYSFELSKKLYILIKSDLKIIIREEDLEDYNFVDSKSLIVFKNIKNSKQRNFCEQIYIPKMIDEKYKDFVIHYPDSIAPIMSRNKKIVITVHDLAFKSFSQGFTKKTILWKNFMTALSFKKARKIIAITNFSKSELFRYYKNIKDEDVRVVYNGFNKLSKYAINNGNVSEKIDGINKSKYILTVSTISPRKNIDTLIKAFNLIGDKRDINLVIAGTNGWLYENIYDLAKKSRFSDRIIFTGQINDDELKFLYKNAEVFVYPSFYEGFGLPPLEALSYGTRVIVSDVACFREVLGNSCFYFNPIDYNELSTILDRNLNEGINDDNVFNFNNMLNKYSWGKCAEETVKVYNDILKGV